MIRLYSTAVLLILVHSASIAQVLEALRSGRIVATRSDSRSVNIIDFNNDGWDDVFISNGVREGQDDLLYINNGDGSFIPVINQDIVSDNDASVGATFGDFDNDGHIDAYVTTWYGRANHIYKNDGAGELAGSNAVAAEFPTFSESAAWGDYDNDGLLDLYVTNSDGNKRNQLYHNEGQGVFTQVTDSPVVADNDASRCANWIDFDDDGDLDLFVTNESSTANDLFVNIGNGAFEKGGEGAMVSNSNSTMSSSWGDIDNDGDLDLFIANAGFFVENTNQLFRNDDGSFVQVLEGDIIADRGCNYGSGFGDIDNDGDLDLMVTSGFCNGKLDNFLYENDGTGIFTNRSDLLSGAKSVCSYGVAMGDLDQNGFLDIVIANCKNGNSDFEQSNSVLFNGGNSSNWYQVRLEGTSSNRSAIGAKIKLKATVFGQPTWQRRDISAHSGYSGQNSLVAHFGIGDATEVDSVIVEWPSGDRSVLINNSVNEIVNIKEGVVTAVSELGLQNEELSFKVFPNPLDTGEQELYLEWSLEDFSSVRQGTLLIFDVNGTLISSEHIRLSEEGGQHRISLSDITRPGIYFVTVRIGSQVVEKRVVVR